MNKVERQRQQPGFVVGVCSLLFVACPPSSKREIQPSSQRRKARPSTFWFPWDWQAGRQTTTNAEWRAHVENTRLLLLTA